MTSAPAPAVDERSFRDAMARWASGVAVVVVRDAQGFKAATVTAFCSGSLRPPLVFVAMSETSQTLARSTAAGRFTVSFLAESQGDVAGRVASGGNDGALFDDDGAVRGALLALRCAAMPVQVCGDHVLLVGRVEEVREGPGERPLIYWGRGYRALAR